jgi:hypothetical protein
MTTRTDYTAADWATLLNAPLLAGAYVCLATINGLTMPQEAANLLHAIDTQPAPAAACELVAAVAAEIRVRGGQNEKVILPRAEENLAGRQQIRQALQDSLAVLAQKSPPEERAGFYLWLMSVARAILQSGHAGEVSLSAQERAALDELEQAFGLDN